MNRLTADDVRGIWAGITMVWDEKYRFVPDLYAQNIERIIEAQVHGIYTTGSTGEFYALEFEEFCAMVDIQAELCGKAAMSLQIGCCSDATGKTIRLLEYAAGKEAVGAAQVCLPYWMEMTDREILQFFKDIYAACPDLPLVHYNIPRSNRFLFGPDYVRLLEAAPSLIGVKFSPAGAYFSQLQMALTLTPDLSYFVGENLLVSAMQIGARGSYSSVVFTDPKFCLDMYAAAQAGRWSEAMVMQKRIACLFDALDELLEQFKEGGIDPVGDKGLGVAAGCILGHQRCRPPYIGWSDETILKVRSWLKEDFPDFVHPSIRD